MRNLCGEQYPYIQICDAEEFWKWWLKARDGHVSKDIDRTISAILSRAIYVPDEDMKMFVYGCFHGAEIGVALNQ